MKATAVKRCRPCSRCCRSDLDRIELDETSTLPCENLMKLEIKNATPQIKEEWHILFNKELWQMLLRYQICRPKFIAIHNQSPLIPIIAYLAGNHFDGHADFHRVVIYIGQLGGDYGAFVQFDERHGIGCIAVVAGGRFVDGGVGVYLTLAAERVKLLGFIATVRADVTRGKNLI